MHNSYARIEIALSDHPNYADPSTSSIEYTGLSFFVTIVGRDLLIPIQPYSKITFILGNGGFQDGDSLYLYDTISKQWLQASCSESFVSHGVLFAQVCHLTQFGVFRTNNALSQNQSQVSATSSFAKLYFILAIVLPIVITLLIIALIVWIVRSGRTKTLDEENPIELINSSKFVHDTKIDNSYQIIDDQNIEMTVPKPKQIDLYKDYDSTLSSNESSNSSASSFADAKKSSSFFFIDKNLSSNESSNSSASSLSNLSTTSSSSYYATNENYSVVDANNK